MSYADARLDLSAVGVACLSGMNGAGKSAILDGVTWAIWECARSGSDELIRMGQTNMWVDLTFELEGQTYRIRRARQRVFNRHGTKIASRGTLEFQIWQAKSSGVTAEQSTSADELAEQFESAGKIGEVEVLQADGADSGSGAWVSLSAPGMRQTQSRICQTLRMDYDTFINSVYLKQGRADEFTTRPPGERKQVLSEILGLSYFDRLQELSRQEAHKLKAQMEALSGVLAPVQALDFELSSTIDELDALGSDLLAADVDLTLKDEVLLELTEEADRLKQTQAFLSAAQKRCGELSADLSHLRQQEQEMEGRLNCFTQLSLKAPEIEKKVQEFTLLKERVEHLDGISLKVQGIQDRRLELKSALANLRGRMEVELEHLKGTLAELSARLKKLKKDTDGKEKVEEDWGQYKKLLEAESEYARKQENFSQLSGRADQLQGLVSEARVHLSAELEQKMQALQELRSLLESKDTLLKGQEELISQAEELEKLETEFELVEEKGLKIKSDVEAAQSQINECKRRVLENEGKIQELCQASSSSLCPLCSSPIVDRLAVVDRYRGQNKEIDSEISTAQARIEDLENKRAQLRKRYMELRGSLSGRKALDIRIGEFNASVSALARADTSAACLQGEIERLQVRLSGQDYAQVERESLINVKAELHKLDFDPVIYANLQSQLRRQRNSEARYQQLRRDLLEASGLREEIPVISQRIDALSSSLQADDFAGALRQQINSLDEELGKTGYDPSLHQDYRRQLKDLLPFCEQGKEIERAERDIPPLRQSLFRLADAIASKESEYLQLTQSSLDWRNSLARGSELESDLARAQSASAKARLSRDQIDRAILLSTTKLEQLRKDKETLSARLSHLSDIEAELSDYLFLAEAFGKKGIQALIIENAVPEIEAEANHILARLSDNQMHIAMITQHKTRQGLAQETLDIVIADDIGTRNYELYSGGEHFKINFAIRLALSRLLSRRAGAKLQSLIIDEGFGSQDEASRYRLIKAINSIKHDFARILVVTHISEMKELFPVQIAVTKEDGISSLEVFS